MPHGGAGAAFGLDPSPVFPRLEEDVLDFWRRDDTFAASVQARQGCPEWVFYDGPPFANGLPHYGHLLTGYAKDLFPRYQTMRGMLVHRRFGWDTHGLPAELEAERQLGITDKSQIEKMGIAQFNEAARQSVLKYTREWQEYVTRQARWVDFEGGYKTLDTDYMESVLWAFKQLYDKGLAYEGYRVLPYCWRDQTPLSNHELRMDDDVYKMRQDQTVTITFPLEGEKARAAGLEGVKAIAWTTTPWTLPTNLALVVGPDIVYAVVPAGPEGAADTADGGAGSYLLARDLVGAYAKDLGYHDEAAAVAAVTATIPGRELADIRYRRLWDYYADAERFGTGGAWRILVDDYVATDEGTGIVHQAPAYGEDDQRVCAAAGIPVVVSVDAGGRFLPDVPEVAGLQVFDANMPIVRMLRLAGRLLRLASYEHSYPHCWRCRNPLIYKAVSSWFIRVPEFRDRMVQINQQIEWVPENVKDGQFGKWLAGARDWSISRNRYWGSPIPVWKSDDPQYPRIDVYGSLAELERDFGALPHNDDGEVDLHRPYVDALTRPNPDDPTGGSTMRRITDVLDVWFDSGSMPYAQVHYPFENREWFDTHNPADFIVEYIGQTRGWFYLLHVLATALFDRPAFKRVVSHGIVLGNDGQKMSKSLRNYPDVNEVFDRDGSDAMRWFLMSSPVLRGGNLIVTEEGIREGVRQVILPLWNTWYFFALYANACGYEARHDVDSTDVLDRYLLAKTHDLIVTVTANLDALDATSAAAELRDFADILTNWYVRRSRDRFWAGVREADGRRTGTEAFDTLYTVLEAFARLAAPLLPMVTERVWKGLTGGRSVHLTDWPAAAAFPEDGALVRAMDRVRAVTSTALSLRKRAGLRVRLPLSRLSVIAPEASSLAPFSDILHEELNVKAVDFDELAPDSAARYGISTRLSVNARAAGPRLGRDVQKAIAAARAGEWSAEGGEVVAGGIRLIEGEYEIVLDAGSASGGTALLPGGGFVLLATDTTPELEAEGLARDVIRAVQDTRKAAGLDVSDRIHLVVAFASEDDREAVSLAHEAVDLAGETLATLLQIVSLGEPGETGAAAAEQGEAFGQEFAAGRFANAGVFRVSVAKEPVR
ncbi:MAG TPA: isoleucine--tRNA ligase [Microbacteriaceae bacterium]|nr:isoleucine--tRNA ligase [Microbacteriaceae bacterium]